MKTYDSILKLEFADQISDTYKSLIFNYLNNYIGPQAATKVRDSIAHLINSDQQDLAKFLIKDIRKKYSDRQSLLEGLGGF